MYRKHIWDIRRNIGAEEKEAQNIEEIKSVKERNNFLINSSYFYFTLYKVVLSSKNYLGGLNVNFKNYFRETG